MYLKPPSVYLQYLLPQHLLSRFAGWVAHIESPCVKQFIIDRFAKQYQVNLEEAELTDTKAYPHFSAFFTRHLKADARPIDQNQTALVSPCDGTIYQIGQLTPQLALNVKQTDFQLAALVGDTQTATALQNGQFLINYLSPKDYHRVHIPADAHLEWMRYIPGKLFSVSFKNAPHIPNIFSRNERVVLSFKTERGPFVCILVGALNVGSINTTWAGTVAPSNSGITTHHYSTETEQYRIYFKKGQEIGYFNFGSTVICLFPPNQMQFESHLTPGYQLKMGERIGVFNEN